MLNSYPYLDEHLRENAIDSGGSGTFYGDHFGGNGCGGGYYQHTDVLYNEHRINEADRKEPPLPLGMDLDIHILANIHPKYYYPILLAIETCPIHLLPLYINTPFKNEVVQRLKNG